MNLKKLQTTFEVFSFLHNKTNKKRGKEQTERLKQVVVSLQKLNHKSTHGMSTLPIPFNIRNSQISYSPVKIAKIEKKNRVVLKIGRIVEGNVLNNILKVPAEEGEREAGGYLKEAFSNFF